jgi:DNA-binding response OmpR family regulator
MMDQSMQNDVVTAGDVMLDHRSLTLTFEGRKHRLTPVEAALLDLLLRNHDQIVRREDIVRTVWEGRAQLSRSIVAVYIYSLRKMLEPTPTSPQRILSVSGQGYLLRSRTAGETLEPPSRRRRLRRRTAPFRALPALA